VAELHRFGLSPNYTLYRQIVFHIAALLMISILKQSKSVANKMLSVCFASDKIDSVKRIVLSLFLGASKPTYTAPHAISSTTYRVNSIVFSCNSQ